MSGGAVDSSSMGVQFDDAVEAFRSGNLERARILAEAELSSAPSASAHHLLGLIHCRTGDPTTGVDQLRAAVEAEPGNANFRIMLMRALVDAGRPAEVLAMPEPPPVRSGATLEEWRARGEAADSAGHPEMAEAAWSIVVAAAPNDWRAWANLGRALTAHSRWNEAVAALEKAVRLNPTDASVRSMLAGALASGDRHEDALAAIDAFERLGGAPETAALARGRSLLGLMRFDAAEQAYREALKHSPGNAEAYRELGILFERTNRLDFLADLLAEAEAAEVPDDKLTYLRAVRAQRERRFGDAYALAASKPASGDDPVRWERLKWKVADAMNRPAEAFAAAEAMNRLVGGFDEWRRHAAGYRARLRELARSLSSRPALPQLSHGDRRAPAFLVGFPRSGTTLLDTFLMGHGETRVLEEVHLLGAAELQIGKISDLPKASTAALERARRTYLSELDRHVARDFGGLVVDKLPMNLVAAHFINAIFPGAKIIFAQRHPCDAVLSGFMQSFVMNDAMASFLTIEDSADLYDASLSCWRSIREVTSLNIHVVRYEQLVSDPEAELRPLIDFLELPWEEKLLAHTDTARQRGAVITASYDQVTEPVSTRSVSRWERYREQLEPVLPVLLPWAEWLGYTP